ncbi:MAG: hypothetical protein ABI841_04775 [Chloroflexota bacterium]
MTATSGVATTFSLTATNLDLLTELGCLEVDLPETFDIVGATAGTTSNGDAWEAVVFPNKVAAHSLSGGGRLELGQSITFTITAVATQAGTWTWTNHAHRPQDCSGAEEIGTPIAVLVLLGATPTPTPTPEPTPPPTPTPTPVLPIVPLPTLPPLPTVRPATPTPTVFPSSAATSPTPSPSPVATAGAVPPVGGGAPPSAPALDASGAAAVVLGLGEPDGAQGSVGEVSLGPLGVIDGITVWAIPGAIVGGPGLLVILWVILQAGVALAWIPAVKRMRGKDEQRPAF